MKLYPTLDGRISETAWVPYANALVEVKYYFAKVDNLLIYLKAHRGVSYDILNTSDDKVHQSMLDSAEEIEDNSLDQFNKLKAYLDKPL